MLIGSGNSMTDLSAREDERALPDVLSVRGARVNNLRGVDLDLPHRAMVVFTGVSGSGKSSLAFDTIYAEGQRRQVQSMSTFARQFMDEMEKPDVDRVEGLCSAVAVDQRSSATRSPRSTVGTVTEVYDLLRVAFARVGLPHCTTCGEELLADDDGELVCLQGHETEKPEMASRAFSFNLPFGRCGDCQGLGNRLEMAPWLVVPNQEMPVAAGAIVPWRDTTNGALALAVVAEAGLDPYQPWRSLPEEVRHTLLYAEDRPVRVDNGEAVFTGVSPWLFARHEEAYIKGGQAALEKFMHRALCRSCGGGRLAPAQLAVKVGGLSIAEVSRLTVQESVRFLGGLELSDRDRRVVAQALEEITERLDFLVQVGLGYLTLDRPARTLSGGEAQRIRLASQLGSRLFGLLYVLDEPTAGLHPRDTENLIGTLRTLRAQGNTLVIVEHDHHVIRAADHVVELGPGAGELGGELIFSGTVAELENSEESLTGAFLSGRRGVTVPPRRRVPRPGRSLTVRGARANNLAGIDVEFPLGCFIAVSGVSGAGKSTLVDQILFRALDRALGGDSPEPGEHDRVEGLSRVERVIRVSQAPIGRSGRSTPATYTGVLDGIRKEFAATAEARRRGYKPGRFSFNSTAGRCPNCTGDGTIRIEMYFLPDVFLLCDACQGRRYNEETLEILYRGRTIADVLEAPIEEAADFFSGVPAISRSLGVLCDVGLGYLRLGQSATTLSGGEAQRVKLAAELQRRTSRHTLYLLDEPTTGLHSSDTDRLMKVLHALVDQGHTVITVSHSLEVVQSADWVVDLGPDGGDSGGEIVAVGTPEDVAAGTGHTARFLRTVLGG
ncbi:excinuclease ABC subunit UvrA [Spirillospora sp. NPDC047279]|uniref:excinuclease ABC subunit UvrA n=1 Tax=Spirillospora sp. NPDC047279 TaxID=3155478 RepID=UPI0033C01505